MWTLHIQTIENEYHMNTWDHIQPYAQAINQTPDKFQPSNFPEIKKLPCNIFLERSL